MKAMLFQQKCAKTLGNTSGLSDTMKPSEKEELLEKLRELEKEHTKLSEELKGELAKAQEDRDEAAEDVSMLNGLLEDREQ